MRPCVSGAGIKNDYRNTLKLELESVVVDGGAPSLLLFDGTVAEDENSCAVFVTPPQRHSVDITHFRCFGL